MFNWLFVRQHGGTFVLRIEDTDEARNRPEWTDGIITALDWLGMAPDEGPYFQSAQERVAPGGHRGVVGQRRAVRLRLHPRGDRRADQGSGRRPGTRRRATTGSAATSGCRGARGGRCASGRPTRAWCEVHDLVRGDVEFPLRALEDFICVKGNGKPLFVLANAVDDRTMAISHVIRGEDLLPTTPRQIMLWGALNRAEGVGPGAAGVRPPAAAGQRAGQEALQAARPGGGRDVPRAGLPARGLPQLPGAARAGAPATRRSCRWT